MKQHAQPLTSDNLVLVPGSELPFIDEWKAVAAHLPRGVALVVMAGKDGKLQTTSQQIVETFKASGHPVKTTTKENKEQALRWAGLSI